MYKFFEMFTSSSFTAVSQFGTETITMLRHSTIYLNAIIGVGRSKIGSICGRRSRNFSTSDQGRLSSDDIAVQSNQLKLIRWRRKLSNV